MRIFTQALDGTYGKPAVGVGARLDHADGNRWRTVAEAEANHDGRIEKWDVWHFEHGLYRIVFDSDGYFARLGVTIAYPEVAVIFRVAPETHSFQVQVTLAPYSYSTYFGTLDGPREARPWPWLRQRQVNDHGEVRGGTMRNGDYDPGSRSGAMVRVYRREAGMTQKELAAKARLSVATLRDIEQSRRHRPRPSSLAALADALGLDSEQTATMFAAGRGMASSSRPQRSGPSGPADATTTGQGLWLAMLGPLQGWRDGTPLSFGPPARRAVLGLLLMDPDVGVRRDTIVDTLWGERPPRTAVGLVQAHVSRLRKVLEPRNYPPGTPPVPDSAHGAYRLRLSSAELDLLLFRDLAARAASMQERGDDAAASELYENALGLWRGDPLADVEGLSGHPGIVLLRQQLTTVLLRYAELACALGKHDRVLPRLQALAAAQPLNESAHARLMMVLAGAGQQAAAIRVYEDVRLRLDRELGLYPGAELAEAHRKVLRQELYAGSRGRG